MLYMWNQWKTSGIDKNYFYPKSKGLADERVFWRSKKTLIEWNHIITKKCKISSKKKWSLMNPYNLVTPLDEPQMLLCIKPFMISCTNSPMKNPLIYTFSCIFCFFNNLYWIWKLTIWLVTWRTGDIEFLGKKNKTWS